jgi:hypothetical protein
VGGSFLEKKDVLESFAGRVDYIPYHRVKGGISFEYCVSRKWERYGARSMGNLGQKGWNLLWRDLFLDEIQTRILQELCYDGRASSSCAS